MHWAPADPNKNKNKNKNKNNNKVKSKPLELRSLVKIREITEVEHKISKSEITIYITVLVTRGRHFGARESV
jgi:hypothetical protein